MKDTIAIELAKEHLAERDKLTEIFQCEQGNMASDKLAADVRNLLVIIERLEAKKSCDQ